MATTGIQSRLDFYISFIFENIENTDVLFSDNIYTREDLYGSLLGFHILENIVNRQSSSIGPFLYLETFREHPLVLKWFSTYLPNYPSDVSIKDGLTKYIMEVQSKYGVIFNTTTNYSISAFEIEPTELHILSKDTQIYVHKGTSPSTIFSKTSAYFNYISPGEFVFECAKTKHFNIISRYVKDLDINKALHELALIYWHSNIEVTKLDCLKLYSLANQGNYSDVYTNSVLLSIDLNLSLPEVYDIYNTAQKLVMPEAYPDIKF